MIIMLQYLVLETAAINIIKLYTKSKRLVFSFKVFDLVMRLVVDVSYWFT